MKNKLPLLLILLPLIAGCSCSGGNNGSSIENQFVNAIDLGSLDGTEWKTFVKEDAQKGQTDYYKFELATKYVFDVDKITCLCISAFDTPESYNLYSMKLDFKIYDSSFAEIRTISIKDFLNTYLPDEAGNFTEDVGIGMRCATQDADAGQYYLALTPNDEVFQGSYALQIAPTFAE